MKHQMFIYVLPVFLLLGIACSETPDSSSGHETRESTGEVYDPVGHTCAYCGEENKNDRFGGRLTTLDGEEKHFNAVECLAGYVLQNSDQINSPDDVKVVDYHGGKSLVPVEKARYLRMELMNSPNGLKLIAFTGKARLDRNLQFAYGGDLINWEEVKTYVNNQWAVRTEE